MTAKDKDKLSARALIVWGAGVLCYTLAVTGRTSFGVASVDAIDRFHINAAQLAVFTSLQLAVYAFAQIPVGLLVDRFGPRKLMVAGAFVMALGQVTLAFTTSYPVAIFARMLIGAGDATAFLSVMRLIPAWIPLRHAPLLGQLTGAVGQFGQFLSAVPFLSLLHATSWQTGFVSLGAVGALLALAAGVLVKDSPEPEAELESAAHGKPAGSTGPTEPAERLGVKKILTNVLTNRVCWHGFFVHWTGLGALVVFTLLWGLPIMTLGLGLPADQAGLALSLGTLASVAVGPIVGLLSARFYNRRMQIVMVFSITGWLGWLWFFTSAPTGVLWAACLMNIVMGFTGPVANLGFDSVREKVDRRFVATGTGLANMGGWIAGMIGAQAVGVLLNLRAPDGNYDWADFGMAWIAVATVWACGFCGMWLTRDRNVRRYS
ncbi:nitrate/nitrite transporter [Corynebacterium jeikeium]|uniref:MFS transporter n=1 Tax=Corynebacterium jeikeium TaxID=38289 RepID=UPI0001B719E0|nr:MFS transporter [Corynebacterium jeikeium]EEW16958.1 transporter, major facilitator family protein [Corynebacterium jeikeium ATCC 43734]OOD29656.1 MFS transporter [Corynebacterium jeikeium]WCZ53242.1 putative sulfoacetate transporter SauU [Corynebacterium jeikeium]SUY81447.1 major facilitator superfamily permease [Corynebacterium jeikeium]